MKLWIGGIVSYIDKKKEFRTKEDVVVLLKPSMKSIENGLRNTSNSGRQMV